MATLTEALASATLPAWLDITTRESTRRKTVGMTVEPSGIVTLAVPAGADPARVVAIVRRNLTSLARAVDHAREHGPAYPTKELVSGEGFELFGTSHRLNLRDTHEPPIEIRRLPVGDHGSMGTLPYLCAHPGVDARALVGWYRREGARWTTETLPAYAGRMGVPPETTVTITRLTARRAVKWGEFKPSNLVRGGHGEITLHWALFQTSRALVEYVLIHELAHAATVGHAHGPAWERVMDRTLPGWRERKAALAEVGRHVWMGETRPNG